MYLTDGISSGTNVANLGKEDSGSDSMPFIAALPSALSSPREGTEELARLKGATIIQVGTTTPGTFEGGGLLIDYADTSHALHRIIFAFTECGMWVEQCQPLPAKAET